MFSAFNLYFFRNVKDACVSYFYHEKLIPLQGMRNDYLFEDYAMNLYKEGKVLYGPYWEHINVSYGTIFIYIFLIQFLIHYIF